MIKQIKQASILLVGLPLFFQAHERWDVKTLTDEDTTFLQRPMIETTIDNLVQEALPKAHGERVAEERRVLRVPAILRMIKAEEDGDIHFVISDPLTGSTMIAELPPQGTGSSRSEQFEKLRATIIQNYPHLAASFTATRPGSSTRSITMHTLRKTFGSTLLQAGANFQHVSQLLGHSRTTVTEIYATLGDEDLINAVDKLGHRLGRVPVVIPSQKQS